MYALDQVRVSSSPDSSPEWYDLDYFRSSRARRSTAISLLMAAWIAAIDLCWPRVNISILYVAPLVSLAWGGGLKPMWRSVGLLVVLTYGVFFLKNAIHDGILTANYFDYRLVNRTLSAVTLLLLSRIMLLWIRWRGDQFDTETTDFVRHQESEISASFAVLCAVPLILLIAAIDFVAPADYNLAILYPIPLFIFGWTSSRRLLWATLAVLLSLTAAAYLMGPPPSDIGNAVSLARNRTLASLGMIGVTVMLSHWMGRDAVKDS